MAVKPHILPSSLEEVRDYVKDDTVIISIAAGLTLDRLAGCLPERAKIVRVMPNTPSMVGEGMAPYRRTPMRRKMTYRPCSIYSAASERLKSWKNA